MSAHTHKHIYILILSYPSPNYNFQLSNKDKCQQTHSYSSHTANHALFTPGTSISLKTKFMLDSNYISGYL